jgi:broad specificity phosphatase PhoE
MMRGWSNVPLTREGRKVAKEAAEAVARDYSISKIYASDLRRARQSVEPLEDATGLSAELTPSLRPWNSGELTGVKIPHLDKVMDDYIDHPDKAPPGGESMREFYNRLMSFMTEVLDEAHASPGAIVVMTSVRPIEMIVGYLEGGMRNSIEGISPEWLTGAKDLVPPGGVVELTDRRKKDSWSWKKKGAS